MLGHPIKGLLRPERIGMFYSTVSQTAETNVQTQLSEKKNIMRAWQLKSFGKVNDLHLQETPIPIVKKPKEILVKVKATSINPIDVAMLSGYGNVLLDMLRRFDPNCNDQPTLPLTLGRDFAGEIVSKGPAVRPDLMIGDTIYGVKPPHCQGCHSEYTIADESLVCRMPSNMTVHEACGILYAGMTAWSSLMITGDLLLTLTKDKRALVIGGCGGVGHIAIQFLKASGLEVASTCSPDGIPMLESLKTDIIIDYTTPDHLDKLKQHGKFDIILDGSGNVDPNIYIPFLKSWSNSKFITLRSPLLSNTDNYGLLGGMAKNAADFLSANVSSGAASQGSTVRWGFFMPLPAAVRDIGKFVNEGKIKAIVEKVFDFNDMPQAFELMNQGHRRGKLVAEIKSSP